MYIEPYPEDGIVEGQQAPLQKIKFNKRKSMLPTSKEPELGDVVEFNVVTHKIEGICRAKNIEVIASAASEESLEGRCLGHIIQLSETGGEIRVLGADGTASFLAHDVSGVRGFEKLTVKCEVSFLTEAPGVAKDLKLLPPGTISAKEVLGALRGTIKQLPTDDSRDPKDGVLEYEKDGVHSEVSFAMSDVNEYITSLTIGDEVNFELVRSRYTSKANAHGITLSLRADPRSELGCISMLKKNFGFIKCCERIVDVFFHINALKEGSEPLELNADVRFVPVMDADTNKVVASELEVVPTGTAVFETVSERPYKGTVKIASSTVAGEARGVGTGVIVALIDGKTETIAYEHKDVHGGDVPNVDDEVTFLLLEDRRQVSLSHKAERKGGSRVRRGGRRAVKVTLSSTASPVAVDTTRRAPPPVKTSPDGRKLARLASFSAPTSPVRDRGVARNPAAIEASFDRADTSCVTVSAAEAAAMAVAATGSIRHTRVRGTIQRIIRNAKKLPAGSVLGVVRKTEHDTWGKRKVDTAADHNRRAISEMLQIKGINVEMFEGDVLFWLTDVAPSVRDTLKKRDEVEYAVVSRPLQDGDDVLADMAVDMVRVRPHRPNLSSSSIGKWAPPLPKPPGERSTPSPLNGSHTERRAPKFSGTTSIVVPGPEKGAIGFAAGRGRSMGNSSFVSAAGTPIATPTATPGITPRHSGTSSIDRLMSSAMAPLTLSHKTVPVESFQFKDALAAQAFIPKSMSSESMKAGSIKNGGAGSGSNPHTPRTPRSPLASIVNSAQPNSVDSRFEDA